MKIRKLFVFVASISMILTLFATPSKVNAEDGKLGGELINPDFEYKDGSFKWESEETVVTPSVLKYTLWVKGKAIAEEGDAITTPYNLLCLKVGDNYRYEIFQKVCDKNGDVIKDSEGFVKCTGEFKLHLDDCKGEISLLGVISLNYAEGYLPKDCKAYCVEGQSEICKEIWNNFISEIYSKVDLNYQFQMMTSVSAKKYQPYIQFDDKLDFTNKEEFEKSVSSTKLVKGNTYLVETLNSKDPVIIGKDVFNKIYESKCTFIFDTFTNESSFTGRLEVQWIIDGSQLDKAKITKDIDLSTESYLYNDKIQYNSIDEYKNSNRQDEISTPISGFKDFDTLEETNQGILEMFYDEFDKQKECRLKYYIDYLKQFDMSENDYDDLFRKEYERHNGYRIIFANNGELPGEFTIRTEAYHSPEDSYYQNSTSIDLYYLKDDGTETLVQENIPLTHFNGNMSGYDLKINHNSTYTLKEHKSRKIDVIIPPTQLPDNVTKTTITISQDKSIIENILSQSVLKDQEIIKALEDAKKNGYAIEYSILADILNEKEANEISPNQVSDIKEFVNKNGIIANFIDIDISCDIDNGESVNGYTIFETNKEILFKIAIPKDLQKDGRNFSIIRIHDGEVEKIKSVYKDGVISFGSEKFSMFALVYNDVEENVIPNDPVNPSNPSTPDSKPVIIPNDDLSNSSSNKEETVTKDVNVVKTSDDSRVLLYSTIMVTTLFGIGLLTLIQKRKDLKQK
ncbi:MAG: hypothetical protein ACLUVC_02595 [Longibaculum sp.]